MKPESRQLTTEGTWKSNYAALSMDLDVNLGKVKVKKAGLNGAQQVEIIKRTVAPIMKANGALIHWKRCIRSPTMRLTSCPLWIQ